MSAALPSCLSDLMATFDGRRDWFDFSELRAEIGKVNPADVPSDQRDRLIAEFAAAALFPHEGPGDSSWGCYFGPCMAWGSTEVPDRTRIVAATVEYWRRRSNEATHPTLIARYADASWEFSTRLKVATPTQGDARRAIEAYARASSLEGTPVWQIRDLRRAVTLAWAAGDDGSRALARRACIDLFLRVATPDALGHCCFPFEVLWPNRKRLLLDRAEWQPIVERAEAVLAGWVGSEDPVRDHHKATTLGRLLAGYYESVGQAEDRARVVRAFCSVVRKAAGADKSPLRASYWLQEVVPDLEGVGEKGLRREILLEAAEQGKDGEAEMQEVVVPLSVTKEDVEVAAGKLMGDSLAQTMQRIAASFVIPETALRQGLEEKKRVAPLSSMFSVTKVDVLTRARIPTPDEDEDGAFVGEAAEKYGLLSLFLEAAMTQLAQRWKPSPEGVVAELEVSPFFDPARRHLLLIGFDAYLRGQYVAAMHIFVPQVEHGLRRLLGTLGEPTAQHKRGVFMEKDLNSVLSEEAIKGIFPVDIRRHLRALLSDARGWNIRNVICHGLEDAEWYTRRVADWVVQILFLMRGILATGPASEGGASER